MVSKGVDLLFSMRGMDRHARVVRSALTVEWGSLKIAFHNHVELSNFMAALRYVELEEKIEHADLTPSRWIRGLLKLLDIWC